MPDDNLTTEHLLNLAREMGPPLPRLPEEIITMVRAPDYYEVIVRAIHIDEKGLPCLVGRGRHAVTSSALALVREELGEDGLIALSAVKAFRGLEELRLSLHDEDARLGVSDPRVGFWQCPCGSWLNWPEGDGTPTSYPTGHDWRWWGGSWEHGGKGHRVDDVDRWVPARRADPELVAKMRAEGLEVPPRPAVPNRAGDPPGDQLDPELGHESEGKSGSGGD